MGLDPANPTVDSLKGPLGFSAVFHAFLLGALLVSSVYSHRGDSWGGPGGGAVTIGLVGSVSGVPLPRPEVVTTSQVVDETKGLYKSQPQPVIPPPDAEAIPKFERNKPPKFVSHPSKILENPAQPPPNAVPYGQGGAPSVPYTTFAMGTGSQAGLGMTGAGGGNFGSQFPWYVEALQKRITSNWLQSTVDPSIRWAPRIVATFQVSHDGTVTNIQITQSSGNASVNSSAVRAIRDSSPLNPLPNEYRGSYVSVEFWFEFRR